MKTDQSGGPMKIVLTVHEFLPDYWAGTEIITLNVARELRRRGHDIRIVTGFFAQTTIRDENRFDRYQYDGFPIDRFHHNYQAMGNQTNVMELEYNNHLFGRFFQDYLRRHSPDLVHFFHLARLSGSAVDACVQAKIPTVFTATDFWTICPMIQLRLPDNSLCPGPDHYGVNCLRHLVIGTQAPKVAKRLRVVPDWTVRVAMAAINHGLVPPLQSVQQAQALSRRPQWLMDRLNQIDRVIAPSRLMANILRQRGLDSSRLINLPYGLDLGNVVRRRDKGSGPRLRIGFAGTLQEHKGCAVLIEAVRLLPKEIPVDVQIHGDCGQFQAYLDRLKGLAADDPRIHFRGPFDHDQVWQVLAEIDVLVVPSIWHENTPLVIYEAHAAGVPVVATNLGGISEVVSDNVNGLLFEKGDARQLSGLLRKLAEDRAMVARLAAATKPPGTIAQHVDALESIYSGLCP
jgi:glycosyltransferase involved in cell wall biosynthesis